MNEVSKNWVFNIKIGISEAAFLFVTNIQTFIFFTLKGKLTLISSQKMVNNAHSH